MSLTRAQCIRELRNGARKLRSACSRYDAASPGLLDVVALAEMRESRERIDRAQDALDAMIKAAFERQRKRRERAARCTRKVQP